MASLSFELKQPEYEKAMQCLVLRRQYDKSTSLDKNEITLL